jgi:hypothetical protein
VNNVSSTLEQPVAREDVLQALRELAARGATVRELVHEILTRLGYKEDAVLPVLWYFTQAFRISLPDVLPIREWMGTDRDAEIDALILPAIEKARSQWLSLMALQSDGVARQASPDQSQTAP